MKCQNCGAENSSELTVCKYCSTALTREVKTNNSAGSKSYSEPSSGAYSGTNNAGDDNVVTETVNWIKDLNAAPASAFNLMAFLFSAIWLAGRGNTRDSIRLFVLFNITSVLGIVLNLIKIPLPAIIKLAELILSIYLAYLVGTRSHLLAKTENFDWGKAIPYLFAYWLIVAIISYVNLWVYLS
jgi:hypothetical protein